ncbi:hypothetical protein GDO86_004955 [Hymenochirus boettgeri]|uniref:Cytochrome c oxidase assembly factor 6 n=1 Tax=Hymenochirus boettgeri TaxID=247094 RepID=A0A8T2J048_9PIPI|nr:hypothetical protein GDO86_004955 [Hymenochirus boettgeri]
MEAPNAKERQACWDARDGYWRCLDSNDDNVSKCQELRQRFESSCPQQWLKHFDKKRDFLKFKEKLHAGEYQPPDGSKAN